MTIEGTVNVEGKVEINNSSKINNLYTIARRAKDNNDQDSAKKYYDLVLQEDPLSWEATFFLAYFDAIYCKNGELKLKAIKMCNCIESVVNLIHQSNISLKEKVNAYTMIASHVVLISNSLQERAKNFRNSMIGIRAISPTSLLGAGKDVKEYRETVAYMISCKFIFSDTLEQYIDEF